LRRAAASASQSTVDTDSPLPSRPSGRASTSV
jgi:hypothetical protein